MYNNSYKRTINNDNEIFLPGSQKVSNTHSILYVVDQDKLLWVFQSVQTSTSCLQVRKNAIQAWMNSSAKTFGYATEWQFRRVKQHMCPENTIQACSIQALHVSLTRGKRDQLLAKIQFPEEKEKKNNSVQKSYTRLLRHVFQMEPLPSSNHRIYQYTYMVCGQESNKITQNSR